MNKYTAFEYDKLVEEYLVLYPAEKPLFDTLTINWKDAFTAAKLFMAGGFIMKLYNKMPLGDSDIDVWTPNSPSYMQAMVEAITDQNWKIIDESDYAISLDLQLGRKVQFVKKQFGNHIEKIVNSFDFTNCKCYTDFTFIYVHEKAVDCLSKGKLKDGQPRNPYLHLERTKKYVGLGFKPAGVLKRKIHEARIIELLNSLNIEEEQISEAIPAQQVLHLRHNQQLPVEVQPEAYNPHVGGVLAGGVQMLGGAAGHAGIFQQEQVFARVVDGPGPEVVPPMPQVSWGSSVSMYSSLHNMGMYLPKYAAWLQREEYKRQEEEYKKRSTQTKPYKNTPDWLSVRALERASAAIHHQDIGNDIRHGRAYRVYIEQNQAPRGPRQGR